MIGDNEQVNANDWANGGVSGSQLPEQSQDFVYHNYELINNIKFTKNIFYYMYLH